MENRVRMVIRRQSTPVGTRVRKRRCTNVNALCFSLSTIVSLTDLSILDVVSLVQYIYV